MKDGVTVYDGDTVTLSDGVVVTLSDGVPEYVDDTVTLSDGVVVTLSDGVVVKDGVTVYDGALTAATACPHECATTACRALAETASRSRNAQSSHMILTSAR